MATDDELAYLSSHPGGFDRAFFEENSLALLEQWRKWAEVDEDGYLVEVETAQGSTFSVAYARYALTWGAFFTETLQLVLVPYRDIVRVSFRRRPADSPKRSVGFTAEGV